MTTSTKTAKQAEPSLARDWINFAASHLGPYLGGRRGLMISAVAVLVAGAALNWSWLVATGIAPLILAVAPCAAMCALGLCMSRMGGQSCSTQSSSAREDADVRSASAAPESEIAARPMTPAPEPIVAAAADVHAGDGEERPAARTQNEATSERS